jgi:hypothetical protein
VRRDVPAAKPKDSLPALPAPAAVIAPAPAPAIDIAVSPIGTRYRPSVGPRGRGADYDNARKHFRLPNEGDWLARMKADPGVFAAILSDIFREARAEAQRQSGQARIGRRPRVIEGSLGELWDMITPQYSNEPFARSVRVLMGDMSIDDFCQITTISRTRLTAMCNGQGVDMWRLEMIARAFDVSPAYFLEWRTAYVLTLVEELVTLQPGLSIRYARAFTKASTRKATARPSTDRKLVAV